MHEIQSDTLSVTCVLLSTIVVFVLEWFYVNLDQDFTESARFFGSRRWVNIYI